MNITVGLGLDTLTPNCRKKQLGSTTVGERGFIEYLQFYAGISASEISSASRIITYLNILKICDDGKHY